MNFDALREALESMVFQFGYRGVKNGQPTIWTGGLSALEEAFEALGWDNPTILPEEGLTCEVEGCMEEDTCGMRWGDMYLRVCSQHHMDCVHGLERPAVKAYAIHREAQRVRHK